VLRSLSILLLAVWANAVEIRTTTVAVVDGDTITVQPAPGMPALMKRGLAGEIYIRLLCVDTGEIWEKDANPAPEGLAARELLRQLCPPGTAVVLSAPGDSLETDRYHRVLAFVSTGEGKKARTLQERLVEAGWSAYWRRYAEAPQPLHDRLLQLEATARANAAGGWKTQPELMARKSAERPRQR
jgi:endonuclease YncB( thermonuclease family)